MLLVETTRTNVSRILLPSQSKRKMKDISIASEISFIGRWYLKTNRNISDYRRDFPCANKHTCNLSDVGHGNCQTWRSMSGSLARTNCRQKDYDIRFHKWCGTLYIRVYTRVLAHTRVYLPVIYSLHRTEASEYFTRFKKLFHLAILFAYSTLANTNVHDRR